MWDWAELALMWWCAVQEDLLDHRKEKRFSSYRSSIRSRVWIYREHSRGHFVGMMMMMMMQEGFVLLPSKKIISSSLCSSLKMNLEAALKSVKFCTALSLWERNLWFYCTFVKSWADIFLYVDVFVILVPAHSRETGLENSVFKITVGNHFTQQHWSCSAPSVTQQLNTDSW